MKPDAAASSVDPSHIKVGSAWAGTAMSYCLNLLGFKDWADFAAFLAALYSLILIGEWIYKRFMKKEKRDATHK